MQDTFQNIHSDIRVYLHGNVCLRHSLVCDSVPLWKVFLIDLLKSQSLTSHASRLSGHDFRCNFFTAILNPIADENVRYSYSLCMFVYVCTEIR